MDLFYLATFLTPPKLRKNWDQHTQAYQENSCCLYLLIAHYFPNFIPYFFHSYTVPIFAFSLWTPKKRRVRVEKGRREALPRERGNSGGWRICSLSWLWYKFQRCVCVCLCKNSSDCAFWTIIPSWAPVSQRYIPRISYTFFTLFY